jgi:uncharacterized protein (DUF362 family)
MRNRREFMKRAGVAAAAAGAVGVAGSFFYRDEPFIETEQKLVTVPDFSVAPIEGKTISVATGSVREQLVRKAVDALGGIERFVSKGDVVMIKPNIAFATPAMLGATANPALIAEVVRMCYSAGASEVLVADNPINDPQSCLMLSGIEKAVTDAGARVILPQQRYFSNTTLAGGELIKNWPLFYEPLRRADKLIGITPVKHHHRSGASMSMKNWYGLLGGRRNIFHQNINTIIKELAVMVRPTLVILDGVTAMVSNGPTGGSTSDLRATDTLIVSCDQVAADTIGASLLGTGVNELAYLKMAEEAGAGTTDYESLNPVYL